MYQVMLRKETLHALKHLILDEIKKSNLNSEIKADDQTPFEEVVRKAHESGGILSGSVKVKGMETTDSNQMEISKEVGLVFQNPDDQIFSTIVEDEVAFGPENLCFEQKEIDKKVTEALQIVGMSDHRLDSTNSLSGGQKQRICIASMLAMNPEILAMDS